MFGTAVAGTDTQGFRPTLTQTRSLIHVTSTSGLSIKGNQFPQNPPRNPDDQPGSSEPILIENCDTKP
jgi:hypothetical protein